MDWLRRLANSTEPLALNLLARRTFTRPELAAFVRFVEARSKQRTLRPFRREKEARFLAATRARLAGKFRIAKAVAALMLPEIANADRNLAHMALNREILSQEELRQLRRLLAFQGTGKRLEALMTAVDLRLERNGNAR